MDYQSAHISLRGNRANNQDRCTVLAAEDAILLLLADGMGGHPRGEVAAQVLIDMGLRTFEETIKPIASPQRFLERIFRRTHREIVAFGLRQTPPTDPRTTAVAVLIQNDGVYWSHIGDSRFYLFREQRLIARTQDHSFVGRMEQNGLLTAEQSRSHPLRNYVTHCLGGGQDPGIASHGHLTPLRPRDLIVLCSDGLWSQLPPENLRRRSDTLEPMQQVVVDLAQQAELKGAPNSDNVSLILLRWLGKTKSRMATNADARPVDTRPLPAVADEQRINRAIEELRRAVDAFDAESKQEQNHE